MASSAAKRRITRETVTEVEADDADETTDEEATPSDETLREAPIFSSLLKQARKIETISVRRTDPESGYLGTMSTDVTEGAIKARWGGGTYCIEGKNSLGQLVKGARHICKLAGDPIFTSELEEKLWRKANGLKEKAPDQAQALSIKDLLMLMDEKDEKRRTEQLEREAAARKESEERETRERLAREEREAKDRAAREEMEARRQKEADEREERRRREAREDEDRRARQHKEDMERLSAQNANALQQTQQFFNQLATTMKTEAPPAAADPIKTLLAGVQLAQAIGGGAAAAPEEGALMSLVRRLPETLAEVRKTGAAVHSELARKGRATKNAGAGAGAADEITIAGPLAAKAKAVIAKLQRAGKNPEAEIDKLLTFAAAAIPDEAPAPTPATKPARRTAAPARRRPPPRLVKSRRG